MTDPDATSVESLEINVIDGGEQATWAMRRTMMSEPHRWKLELVAPDGRIWAAEEFDVFACLYTIREQLESGNVKICCNGARLNAGASGMLRQMSGGNTVYLLSVDRDTTKADRVPTLGPAPCAQIASTVAEQKAFYRQWIEARRQSREAERST